MLAFFDPYDQENIPDDLIQAMEKYLEKNFDNVHKYLEKSSANEKIDEIMKSFMHVLVLRTGQGENITNEKPTFTLIINRSI
jgi:hypothetical protein